MRDNDTPLEAASQAASSVCDPAAEAKHKARRRNLSRLGALASFILIAVSLIVLWRIFGKMDVGQVRAAFFRAGAHEVALAAGCAALSYLLLTGYDALAMRELNIRIPYRTTALGSFTSYAVSFTLGFPVVTAGTVRYWIYAPRGVSASNVARLTVVAGLTFWLGMAAILGIGLLFEAKALSQVDRLAIPLNRLIGLAVLCAIGAYFIWISTARRSVTIQGWRLTLPSPGVTLAQMLLGAGDVCAGAAVLYILLPEGLGIGFPTFAAIYAVACMIGIASHAPGGIGVFETTILLALPWLPYESVLGALLLFRLLYYVIPFVLALMLLGAYEVARHIRSAPREFRHDDDVHDTAGPKS